MTATPLNARQRREAAALAARLRAHGTTTRSLTLTSATVTITLGELNLAARVLRDRVERDEAWAHRHAVDERRDEVPA